MFQRVNFGEVTNEKNRRLPDLSTREWALMIPTVALAILMGVAPGIFLKAMEPSVVKIVQMIGQVAP
jgi:NADH-quinone oxidoreductase subunit M